MRIEEANFAELLSGIVDNRGRTCPTAEDGIPLIATNCIRNDALYPVFEKIRFVDEETYRTWFRGHPEPGDLIFVCKGSPGRVCMTPDPVPFCIAQDMVALRANDELIYPKYLFAALRSPVVQERIAGLHVGSLIPHFKKGDFDKLSIPLPNRDTQVAIGDYYFDLSFAMELNRQTTQTCEKMARALFRAWFVDFEPVKAKAGGATHFPGMPQDVFDELPDAFEDTETGPIPVGWDVGVFGDMVTILDSKRIPLSKKERAVRHGPFPYYGATGVLDYVDDFLFEGPHVLLGEDGSVAKDNGTPFVQYVWGQFWVSNHAHVLKGKNGITDEHVCLFLQQANIAPFVTGAVQAKLSQKNMKAIPAVLPPETVRNAFGSAVRHLFDLLRHLSDETRLLNSTRDAFLPKLISGEVRAPVAKEASNG